MAKAPNSPRPQVCDAPTKEFTLFKADANTGENRLISPLAPSSCDENRAPKLSRGFAALDFECYPPFEAGTYVVRLDPERVALSGPRVHLPLRVLKKRPAERRIAGWTRMPLTAEHSSADCEMEPRWFGVRTREGKLLIEYTDRRPEPAKIPVDLAHRLSPAHALTVRYVFDTGDGWLVLFDHGEWGGGIEWFARAGGDPRSIVIGPRGDDAINPQNVNRAMAEAGDLYVLQGLSHLGSSSGQLAKVWREHDHFTSHVIARYSSEPFEWIPEGHGTWIVATSDGIWRTRDDGTSTLLTRLPRVVDQVTSMAQTSDRTFYFGTLGGILRLIPTWASAPRYLPELLVRSGSGYPRCSDPAHPD